MGLRIEAPADTANRARQVQYRAESPLRCSASYRDERSCSALAAEPDEAGGITAVVEKYMFRRMRASPPLQDRVLWLSRTQYSFRVSAL